MKSRFLRCFVLLLGLLFMRTSLAEPLSYQSIALGSERFTLKTGQTVSGFTLLARVSFWDRVYLSAFDANLSIRRPANGGGSQTIRLNNGRLGLGGYWRFAENWGIHLEGDAVSLNDSRRSVAETGSRLAMGLRWQIADQLELFAEGARTTLGSRAFLSSKIGFALEPNEHLSFIYQTLKLSGGETALRFMVQLND